MVNAGRFKSSLKTGPKICLTHFHGLWHACAHVQWLLSKGTNLINLLIVFCFIHSVLPTVCCLITKSCPTLLYSHGLEPARRHSPWDFPGTYTGVGCQFLFHLPIKYSSQFHPLVLWFTLMITINNNIRILWTGCILSAVYGLPHDPYTVKKVGLPLRYLKATL